MSNFRELLEDEIKDLYDAESRIVKALPKMKEHATNKTLQRRLTNTLKKPRDT